MCDVTMRRFCVTIIAVEKQKCITYSEYVFVTLGIQHAMFMRHIFICGLSGSTKFCYITS
jgi:hypothetical protein